MYIRMRNKAKRITPRVRKVRASKKKKEEKNEINKYKSPNRADEVRIIITNLKNK